MSPAVTTLPPNTPRRSARFARLRPAQVRAGWALLGLVRAQPERALGAAEDDDFWRVLLPVLSWTPAEAERLARVVARHARLLEDETLAALPWSDPHALARALGQVHVGGRRRRGRFLPAADLGAAYVKFLEREEAVVQRQLERSYAETARAQAALRDPIRRNLEHCRTLVGWDDAALAVLAVASAAADHEPFSNALRGVATWGAPVAAEIVGDALALDRHALEACLDAEGFLARCGVLEPARQVTDLQDLFRLGRTGRRLLWAHAERPADLMRTLMREVDRGELTRADFAHVEDELDLLERALATALRRGEPGINLLLYGPPGTGKSELARLLAWTAAEAVMEVRIADERGEEPTRGERLEALLLAQRMLAAAPRTVLIMEEAEDIFPQGGAAMLASLFGFDLRASPAGSKAWINRQLETNPVPVIWVSNSVKQMDPAFLRRFTYHLALDRLPRAARARIAGRHLAGIGGSSAFVDQLAADPGLTPATIASAVRFAALVDAPDLVQREAHVRRQIEHYRRAVDAPVGAAPLPQELPYSIDLLNVRSAYPLDRIVVALAQRGRGTLCCHGAPGTGKTALAAHIAERTGRRLHKVTAGDLLSPYIGESERNVARLFREATDPDTVLLIDEAEGLLASRAGAQRRWEFSLTNEFLRRIEEFPGILVVATNLASALDEAFMRRFQFKVELQPLRPEQRVACATQLLGTAAADATVAASLAGLDGLTLGDFATVDRQFRLMGEPPTPAAVLAALQAELAAREATGPRRIGFVS